jgi:hypothetical protein
VTCHYRHEARKVTLACGDLRPDATCNNPFPTQSTNERCQDGNPDSAKTLTPVPSPVFGRGVDDTESRSVVEDRGESS